MYYHFEISNLKFKKSLKCNTVTHRKMKHFANILQIENHRAKMSVGHVITNRTSI